MHTGNRPALACDHKRCDFKTAFDQQIWAGHGRPATRL